MAVILAILENVQIPWEPPWDQPHNPGVPLGRDHFLWEQVIGLIQEVCGPLTWGVQTPIYKKLYPEWIDRQFEVPRGLRS